LGLEPGTIVAKRYRVHLPLGKGGMGEVFAAENTRTGRMVAIKVLRAESKQKQSAIERFRREARAAGSINSDFVTQVLDVEDDPEYGIVLVFELLEGESLVDRLKRTGPLSFTELWGIVEAVWMGLADAHFAGVVHRDLKPSNVFIENRRGGRRVKILDFGISKLPKGVSTESLTQVGQSLGTFSFMPPEQIGKAKNVDHRADIYACTTLIYQALSGKLPYKAKNVVAMMELKNKSEPRTLSEVMEEPVDQGLEAFIARGLARNPDLRFQTAQEALESWRTLRPPGAVSVMDQENTTSGSYPLVDIDPPSSSEAKTIVVRRGQDHPAMRRLEAAGLVAAQGAHPTPMPMPSPLQRTMPEGYVPSSGPAPTSAPVPPSGPMPISTQVPSGPMPGQMASGEMAPMGVYPLDSEPPPPTEPMHARRSGARIFLALLLGAIGLMLVGFFTVALVLHLLQ
jgi:serine/threonine-protein kinase